MKLLTISMPENADTELLDDQWKQMLIALSAHWKVVGKNHNARKMANALVNDLFKVEGELDDEGNPVIPSPLPEGWELLTAHKIQKEIVRNDPLPSVVIAADQITDTEIDRSRRHFSRYVRPVYDNTDPENPVLTGITLLDRHYKPIRQGGTDEEPIYTIDGVKPDPNGNYIKRWKVPGKQVNGVGKVTPDSLQPDGTFIQEQYNRVVVQKGMKELFIVADKQKFKDFMPDVITERDTEGRPTKTERPSKMQELTRLGGYKRTFE